MPHIHHLSPKDAATVAVLALQSAPFKGMMSGPEARAPYDQMIGAIPEARGLTAEPATLGGVPGLWLRPEASPADAAILYLHGGAYVLGSAAAYRNFAGQFAARSGIAAFVADYALAPEKPFPAGVLDARAVYRALLAEGITRIPPRGRFRRGRVGAVAPSLGDGRGRARGLRGDFALGRPDPVQHQSGDPGRGRPFRDRRHAADLRGDVPGRDKPRDARGFAALRGAD